MSQRGVSGGSGQSGHTDEKKVHMRIEKALRAWLTPGVGPKKFHALRQKGFLDSFDLDVSSSGLSVQDQKKREHGIHQALEWKARSPIHHIIDWDHPAYPAQLKTIQDSPGVLFVKGSLDALNSPQMGMVGSRSPSRYGLDVAHDFATQLAKYGVTLTSGLAYGIDAQAHQSAVQAKGLSIGILGSGLLRVYPHDHQRLAQELIESGGALLSELPLDCLPTRLTFPRRNRLISGLSLGVIVIEAAERSGSLITARYAMEQGREVFAVPGSIFDTRHRGSHRLIQQGAALIDCVEEVLRTCLMGFQTLLKVPCQEGLDQGLPKHMVRENSIRTSSDSITENSIPEEFQAILMHFLPDLTPIDHLIACTGLKASQVSSMLIICELEGWVKSLPGGYIKQ